MNFECPWGEQSARADRPTSAKADRPTAEMFDGNSVLRDAVYGTDETAHKMFEYEEQLEQSRRPHVFVRKWGGWGRASGGGARSRNPRLITADEFAEMYAAADFAASLELYLDTHVTIAWSKLGVTSDEDVDAAFRAFIKCASDWLRQRHLPIAWICSHENSAKLGLHTHILLHVSSKEDPFGGFRSMFRKWAQGWVSRKHRASDAGAVRVSGPSTATGWVHWLLFSYLMKGFDNKALMQSSRASPDGRNVFLGDLIAHPWRDPGQVGMRERVSASQSLGASARAARREPGVPQTRTLEGPLKGLAWSAGAQLARYGQPSFAICFLTSLIPEQPFRSTYEGGIRDVRQLYGPDLYERVTRQTAQGGGLDFCSKPDLADYDSIDWDSLC